MISSLNIYKVVYSNKGKRMSGNPESAGEQEEIYNTHPDTKEVFNNIVALASKLDKYFMITLQYIG